MVIYTKATNNSLDNLMLERKFKAIRKDVLLRLPTIIIIFQMDEPMQQMIYEI